MSTISFRSNFALFLIIIALILPGCGKKEDNATNKKVAWSGKALSSDIPVLKEEVEDFFDDDSISEFAFIDDDFEEENNGELKDLFEPVSSTKISPVREAKIDNKSEFIDEEQSSFVAWDDEEDEEEASSKTVYFDLNRNDIRRDQREAVNEVLDGAKEAVKLGKKVIVEGHTCQLGAPSFNIPLSQRRAEIIKREMVKQGIPEDKIKTVGRGNEMPVIWSDKTDKATLVKELSVNRRTEVSVG